MTSKHLNTLAFTLMLSATFPTLGSAQTCGGDLGAFLNGVKAQAVAAGVSEKAAGSALKGAGINKKVLSRDRTQGVFKQTFLEFSGRVVSSSRLQIGAKKIGQYADVFKRAEAEFGVPAPVITAFWALETDFGAVQGDFNTRDALVTLSHDCRRPELFRPQLLAFMKLYELDDVETNTTGAWAGEIGQVQMLPRDILTYGTDGDGDGRVRLKESSPDVIMTAAKFIQSLGYRRGEPWLQEVKIPQNLPFEKTGLGTTLSASDWFKLGVQPRDGNSAFGNLPAALLLPQGRLGPAFLAYPNFDVYLKWNQSFIYTTSAAYFATRLGGAPRYDKGNPENGLDDGSMKELQKILASRGYDVGEIDGILGSGTRSALQKEQSRLGLPADGWATPAILRALR